MNENHTIQCCHSTYLRALELDADAWREADSTANSVTHHFEQSIEIAFDEAYEEENRREREEIEAEGEIEDYLYGEDMDGDAESALASCGFGTDEDYGSFSDFDD